MGPPPQPIRLVSRLHEQQDSEKIQFGGTRVNAPPS